MKNLCQNKLELFLNERIIYGNNFAVCHSYDTQQLSVTPQTSITLNACNIVHLNYLIMDYFFLKDIQQWLLMEWTELVHETLVLISHCAFQFLWNSIGTK